MNKEILKIKKLLKIAKLKVWSFEYFYKNSKKRHLVSAYSQAEAQKRILDYTHHNEWSIYEIKRLWQFKHFFKFEETTHPLELEEIKGEGIWVNLGSSENIVSFHGPYRKLRLPKNKK